jgi:hypothetical protein
MAEDSMWPIWGYDPFIFESFCAFRFAWPYSSGLPSLFPLFDFPDSFMAPLSPANLSTFMTGPFVIPVLNIDTVL